MAPIRTCADLAIRTLVTAVALRAHARVKIPPRAGTISGAKNRLFFGGASGRCNLYKHGLEYAH